MKYYYLSSPNSLSSSLIASVDNKLFELHNARIQMDNVIQEIYSFRLQMKEIITDWEALLTPPLILKGPTSRWEIRTWMCEFVWVSVHLLVSVYLFIHLPISVYMSLSACLCLSIYSSAYICLYVSLCLSRSISLFLSRFDTFYFSV